MSGAVLANVTAVAIGGRALLIEGVPGSGKSGLALGLIDRGAVLIGDDAITVERRGDAAIALPPPNTAGLIEVRNVGIVELPTTSAPIALMLTLDPQAARFPLSLPRRAIAGVEVPLLPFAPGDPAQVLRAERALALHGLAFPDASQDATSDRND